MANPHYGGDPVSGPPPRPPVSGPSYRTEPVAGPSSFRPPPPPDKPPPTSNGKYDPAFEGRKLFLGGLPQGIDADAIRYDFSKFGDIEDCFVPADRNEPGRIRGIGFVTFREKDVADRAIREMHGRNYHGREITCNAAKPRGPDPKRDGTFHTDEKYSGKFDAGGRLRSDLRGTWEDPDTRRDFASSRYDESGRSDAERERDYLESTHTHGGSCAAGLRTSAHPTPVQGAHAHPSLLPLPISSSLRYDGTGRYGMRDPRPVQAYYD